MPTDGVNDSTVAAEKDLVLFLVKQRQSFARFCITTVLIVICIKMKQKSIKFKAQDNIH